MLEVIVDLISSVALFITGFYIISKIIKDKSKLTWSKILIFTMFSILIIIIHSKQYNGIEPLLNLFINVLAYKIVFKINFDKITFLVCLYMALIILSDLLVNLIFSNFVSITTVRNNKLLTFSCSMIVLITTLLILKIKLFYNQIIRFYENFNKKDHTVDIIFFLIIIINLSMITYVITINKYLSMKYIYYFILEFFIGLVLYLYIKNINDYCELNSKYDSMFDYVQNFEEYIEKENLNKHEYKNQLAILRELSKEKRVKDKINDILNDNINLDEETINKLSIIPKGGLKGLLYYKISIAKKYHVDITVDVGNINNIKKYIKNEKQIKILGSLLGIYLDNAIEAAKETKKKKMTIEIYEINKCLNIVISNTYTNKISLDEINRKNFTTKGKGHGKGLYYASKLILKNKEYISTTQRIIEDYYIEKLIINSN